MANLQNDTGFWTGLAGEALTKYRRVKLVSGEVKYADAGEVAIGVTQQTVADGDPVAVKLMSAGGTFLIEAAGAITAEVAVYGANDGKIDDTVSGDAIGIAVETGSASVAIEVIVVPGASTGDIKFADSEQLVFGTGNDVLIDWDGTQFVVNAAAANSAIHVGVDGAGLDVKLFGDTPSSYALWDQSGDKLILEGADLDFGDADRIEFGDAQDITMKWDGTQFLIDQAAANSAIHVGVDDAGIDLKLFGDTSGSYLLWDQSADKLIINAGTADLGTSCEADAYTVGGAAGVDFGPAAPASITVVKGIVTAASS